MKIACSKEVYIAALNQNIQDSANSIECIEQEKQAIEKERGELQNQITVSNTYSLT